ncbi:acetoacetyl-CoA synthetase [Trichonephila clavipes]|nr:acetoacetyl-CoA synthetase [Trichonephila clavipes]
MNGSTNDILYLNNAEDPFERRCTPVWTKKEPDTELQKFKNLIEKKYNQHTNNYWDLHKWSVENIPEFWEEIWHYFNVIASKPYEEVFRKTGKGFLDNEWFKGAAFNLAENILRIRDNKTGLICSDEFRNRETVTYAEIYEQVKLYAAAFRKHGLSVGDRVGYYISSRKEALFAMLATVSIGAIWGGPLPYHGSKVASNIMKTVDPKFIISIDHFQSYGEQFFPIDNLPAIAKCLPGLEKVIIVVTREETLRRDISDIPHSIFLEDFLQSGTRADGTVPEIIFEQLPFCHPAVINFTSGTTSEPKGVVHSAGTFIAQFRDFAFHLNFKTGDVVYTPSPVGWAIWDYIIPSIALGVKLFLFDGSPDFNVNNHTIWDVFSENKVSTAFLAPAFVESFETDNIRPKPGTNLDSLRTVILAGSPPTPQEYKFLLDNVKKDLFVGSLYGATEVFGAFTGFDFRSYSYTCECQVPSLGVDLHCFDEEGNSVIGHRGEIVITKPCPSFPICLWRDENNSKINHEYLSRYPDVWCQNDIGWINPKTKGLVIIGRSDNTLKQYGERVSPNDIYLAISDMEELRDFICVGQDRYDGPSRAILFVKLKDGITFDSHLKKKIGESIGKELFYNVPEVILEVPDIPYNMNHKRMENVVKKIVMTNKIPEVKNIRNPNCLKYYCDIPEILKYNVRDIKIQ